MNEIIDAFVKSLKQEQVYQNYLQAKAELEKHAKLLSLYKAKKEEYIKMRPYFKYQDFSELKKEVQDLSNQVNHLEAFQNYMQAQNDLKERLDGLSQMIFKDVFIEAEVGECVSLQENTNEEI